VERGQAPGLYLARMSTNILYDQLLSSLGILMPLRTAEKIVTSLFVLLFFWSSFSLVAALSRSRPWRLTPLLAMTAYGWTFSAGFMNYYAAVAFGSFGVALWCADRPRPRMLCAVLAVLAWFAHPLGVLWMVGAIAWREFVLRARFWWQAAVIALAVPVLVVLRVWLVRHFPIVVPPISLARRTGIDQFVLYRNAYIFLAAGVFALLMVWLALDAGIRRPREADWRRLMVPAGLWLLIYAVIAILPDGLIVPMYPSAVSYVTTRSTVLLVLLLAALCACTAPRRWHAPALAAVAIAFFGMSFYDQMRLARMERQAEQLVEELPAGVRVVSLVNWPESHVLIYHLADLACLGRCLSYMNYEPASKQFRVRATGPNAIVAWTVTQITGLGVGGYQIGSFEQPIYELYQCRSSDNLCMEQLVTGEPNGMPVVRNGWLMSPSR